MNGYKIVLAMIIHGMIEGCLLKSMQEKKENQHHLNILRSWKRFFGNQPLDEKRDLEVAAQLSGKPRQRKFDRNMKLASYTGLIGKSFVKTKVNKVENKGSLVMRDRVSQADAEVSKIPYIALPPNNVLPDDEKKDSSISNGNRNTVTKQQIPATVIPVVVTAGPPSIIQIPTAKPLTASPIPHASPHPTPQPVNINLVLPTVRPVVQTASLLVNHLQHAEESNVTNIDLNLNIGEDHQKEKPVVIQLPTTTPPPAVVVSHLQKAQEINSHLSLLTNPQLQPAFQSPPFLNSPSTIATMLGLRNLYNPMSIEEMVSQNAYPQGYPFGIPPNILPFQGLPGLSPTLQQGLMGINNPLTGFPNTNQLAPIASLSRLLSNAIKSSLTQSQPDLITSALNQAASQVQAQNQPPQTLTSALTQALAKVVSQNTQPSEEQKLIQLLAVALGSAKTESQKRFFPTASSLKVEIINPTNQPVIPVSQMLKQGRVVGPAEQQIISLNVSPLIPQQTSAYTPPVLPQQNPSNVPRLVPQPNTANAPPMIPQQNTANTPPVIPQQNTANAPSIVPQPNTANAPPIVPQPNTANAPPIVPQQPKQSAPYTSPIFDQISASALGKAMAKALVHTAKKIVYNKSAMQRDKIFKSKDRIYLPRRLQNFIRTTFFRLSKSSESHYRILSAFSGPNAFHRCFGPINMKYVRHRCLCCC